MESTSTPITYYFTSRTFTKTSLVDTNGQPVYWIETESSGGFWGSRNKETFVYKSSTRFAGEKALVAALDLRKKVVEYRDGKITPFSEIFGWKDWKSGADSVTRLRTWVTPVGTLHQPTGPSWQGQLVDDSGQTVISYRSNQRGFGASTSPTLSIVGPALSMDLDSIIVWWIIMMGIGD
ncbi:hypothetical protein DL93DRAFT_2078935, partial [Clavulina sp. PMI_390]